MANPPHQREQVRQRIIQSAAQLFNRHGFTAVSIDDIMAGAGLTRGGFYSYFQSKSELYAEAINSFVNEKRKGADTIDKAPGRAAQIVRE
jgi:TetR/AcrR family transcriptional regulator, transcriptional repressor for nem operon